MADAPVRFVWKGPVAEFMTDRAEQIDLEGAIRSGKTTAALRKVIRSCCQHPGIHWLMCRYSDDDTRTKLRPPFEKLCLDCGVPVTWKPDEKRYEFGNGAWAYCFGIRAQDVTLRFSKFRGITLASIYVDQAEELPHDIYQELVGRLSQPGYPQQLILTPNPMSEDSWLAREFPDDNHIAHRKYYRVSIYDNAHNLDPITVDRLERTYPPGHAKHGPMLLGTRGVNVSGQPVYGALNPLEPGASAFQRTIHEVSCDLEPDVPLWQSLDWGKRHPCVVWGQYTPWGELRVLGGIMGQDLYLDEFIPIVLQYRARWFPEALEVVSCCDPSGSHNNSQGMRQNPVDFVQQAGIPVGWKDDSNNPAVRLAMIERIAGHMRRRTSHGEGFQIDPSRWLRISSHAVVPHRFLADGFEAGYVWDVHLISVGSKQVLRPKKDGWFEHGQNCLEYAEHHFGGNQQTLEQVARRAQRLRAKRETRAQRDHDPYDDVVWRNRFNAGRRGVGL